MTVFLKSTVQYMCVCTHSHVHDGQDLAGVCVCVCMCVCVWGCVRGPKGQGRYHGQAGRCVLPLLSALGCHSVV